jgi:hypothetical protein
MSGLVKIEIRETEKELKAFLRQEKEASAPRKSASSVLAQDPNGRNRIVGCCAARENILPQYKDGCLATLAGGREELLFQKPRSGRPRIRNPEL